MKKYVLSNTLQTTMWQNNEPGGAATFKSGVLHLSYAPAKD